MWQRFDEQGLTESPKKKKADAEEEDQEKELTLEPEGDEELDFTPQFLSRNTCYKEACMNSSITFCITCSRWLCANHAILAAKVISGGGVGEYVYGCLPHHIPESLLEIEELLKEKLKGSSSLNS